MWTSRRNDATKGEKNCCPGKGGSDNESSCTESLKVFVVKLVQVAQKSSLQR